MKRTNNYIITITLNDGVPATRDDAERMLGIRGVVKAMNKVYGTKYYIKLHGRGHRYGNRRWAAELPLKYATTADVYMYKRRTF